MGFKMSHVEETLYFRHIADSEKKEKITELKAKILDII